MARLAADAASVPAATGFPREAGRLCTDASGVPRVVIPNTLDMQVFKPGDRAEARRRFGLPAEGRMILFGAAAGRADPIKGFDLLEAAIGRLAAVAPRRPVPRDIRLDPCSAAAGSQDAAAYQIGELRDPERLAMLSTAADVFVAPSRIDNPAEHAPGGAGLRLLPSSGVRYQQHAGHPWPEPSMACSRPPSMSRLLRRGIVSVVEDTARRGARPSGRTQRSGSDRRTSWRRHVELYRHAPGPSQN